MSQERFADARALTDVVRDSDSARIFPAIVTHLEERLDPSVEPMRPLTVDEALVMAVEYVHAAAVVTSDGSPDAQ